MRRFSDCVLGLLLLLACAGLLLFPQEISAAVRGTLDTCANTLLPSLFPFFILSGFLIRSGISDRLGQKLEFLMRRIFHLSGDCVCAVIAGAVGGYPTGARTAIELYKTGRCSRTQAEHLLAFCSNCGPSFLFGIVGFTVFQEAKYACLLTAVHLAGALLTGIILRPPAPELKTRHRAGAARLPSPAEAFVDSVSSALASFLNLSAFVLCFSAIIALLDVCGCLDLLSGCLPLPISPENRRALLLSALEMTAGVLNLTQGDPKARLVICAAALAWSGLSIHCQVLSLMRDTDLSPRLYFRGKVLHTLLSAAMTAAWLRGSFPLMLVCLPAVFLTIKRISKIKGGNRQANVL